MFSMTEAAGSRLAELLEENSAPEGVAARLMLVENSLTLTMDNPQPGDSTYDHEGRTVLVIDQQITDGLSGRQLDIEETAEGPQLALKTKSE